MVDAPNPSSDEGKEIQIAKASEIATNESLTLMREVA